MDTELMTAEHETADKASAAARLGTEAAFRWWGSLSQWEQARMAVNTHDLDDCPWSELSAPSSPLAGWLSDTWGAAFSAAIDGLCKQYAATRA